MAENTTEEIKKKIEELPENIRQFIYSAEMSKTVQDIGAKNQLHLDQIGALEAEVAAAMIGVTKLEEFSQNVADALNVDEKKSVEVAKDVNDLLFMKIRGDMKAAASPVSNVIEPSKPAAVVTPPTPTPLANSLPLPVKPATPAPVTPIPTSPISTPPPITPVSTNPTPAKPIDVAAEAMLTQKTVSVSPAPTTPPAPANPTEGSVPPAPYNKTDPYREPPE